MEINYPLHNGRSIQTQTFHPSVKRSFFPPKTHIHGRKKHPEAQSVTKRNVLHFHVKTLQRNKRRVPKGTRHSSAAVTFAHRNIRRRGACRDMKQSLRAWPSAEFIRSRVATVLKRFNWTIRWNQQRDSSLTRTFFSISIEGRKDSWKMSSKIDRKY